MTAPDPHRFAALDSWRGLAALAVAFHHLRGSAPLLDNALHDNLARGVDFFFVLSGFVIAFAYGERLAHGFSVARFMVLRWGRVWPLHAAMVLAYVVLELALAALGPSGPAVGRAAFTGPRDLAALPLSFLLLQAWVWPGRDLWNVQSWSISVEMGLYLGAALLWRLAGPRALVIGASLALALGLAAEVIPDQILRGLVGFGLGMGCWALWPRVERRALPDGMATAVEIALVAMAVALIARDAPLLVLDLVFAAMILAFAREQGWLSRLLLTAPGRWLGVLSYGLYMVHGLVFGLLFDALAAAQAHFGWRWVGAGPGGADRILLASAPAALLVAAMMAVALGCAWLGWQLVERPGRNLARRIAAANEPVPCPA